MNEQQTVLVLGASGLVGSHCIKLLLKNDNYSKVYAVSRNGIKIRHPKLEQIIADYSNIVEKIQNLNVDVFFSCIGSTRSKTPDLEQYYQIDHDYPLLVAKTLNNINCNKVCLVSALGANPDAKNFYMKMKGEVERDLRKHYFRTDTYLPSIVDQRIEKRISNW